MKRSSRLCSSKKWIQEYTGNNIIRSYAKWYGVDPICAITELRLSGVSIPDEKLEQAEAARKSKETAKRKQKEREQREKDAYFGNDSDETYAYIAGHTSGGTAFGVTWEETENIEERGRLFTNVRFLEAFRSPI